MNRDGLDMVASSRLEFGREGHRVAAEYLDGGKLDLDQSVTYEWTGDSTRFYTGKIIEAGIELLPEPGTVATEQDFTLEVDGVEIALRFDAIGMTETGIPLVVDHKFVRNIKYRHSPSRLKKDWQVIVYAAAAMKKAGTELAILRWVYYQTVEPYVAKAAEFELTADDIAGDMRPIISEAREIAIERLKPPRPIIDLGARGRHCERPTMCDYLQGCRNLDEQGGEIDISGTSLEALMGDFNIGDGEGESLEALMGEDFGSPHEVKQKLNKSRKKKWKPPPATHRWIDLYRNHTNALADSAELARQHLAKLTRNEVISVYSHGTWSTEHVLSALAEQIGPVDFAMMTWAINDDAVLRFATAIEAGFIRECRALVDERMKVHRPAALDVLQTTIGRGNLAVAPCHGKVYVLKSVDPKGLSVSIVTSANFTQNPRSEASTIIEGRELANWWTERIEDAIAAGSEYHHTGRLKKEWSTDEQQREG